MEPCPECRYSYETLGRQELAPELRAGAERYGAILGSVDEDRLRAHPRADVWSALEYGCHVRDVLVVQRQRVELTAIVPEPSFAPMRRDERVLEERYNDQEPTEVGRQLMAAADALSQTLESLDAAGWDRTGIYNWPTSQVRTVDWIGRHTVHEQVHHLRDIDGLLQVI